MRKSAIVGILLTVILVTAGCSFFNSFINQDDINKAANGSPGGSASSAAPDTTAPVAAITSPSNGQEVAPNATIYGDCSDNIGVLSVTIYYYTNNGVTNYIGANLANGSNFTCALPGLDFGNYIVFAKALDAAGNPGFSSNVNLVVSAIPNVDFTVPVSNGVFYITNVTSLAFSGTATVSNSTISSVSFIKTASGTTTTNSASLGAGTWNYTSALTANTTNTLSVFALAANGKTSQVNTVTVLVDTVSPSLSIVPPIPNYTNTSGFRVDFTAIESLSGMSSLLYTLNGSTNLLNIYDSYFNLSGLADNNYILKIYARDNAGNSNSVTANFGVDTTAPTVTMNPLPTYTNTNGFKVTVTISDAISGISTQYYKVDSGATNTFTTNFINVSGLADGSHTIYCWALDNTGHFSTVQSVTTFVDTVKPVMTFNAGGLPGTVYNGRYYSPSTAFTFPLTVTETGSGIKDRQYKVNGGSYASFPGPNISLSGLTANQTNTISWWSVDNAGNYSVTNTQAVVVDTVAPSITSLNVEDPIDFWVSTGWTNSGSFTDNFYAKQIVVSFINQSDYAINNLEITTVWDEVIDLAWVNSGTETATFTIYDLAGNSSSTSISFYENAY